MEQELRISQRAKQYPASGIRKMFDLAAQYPEAIKLTVGEPNFDTPQYIKDAAKRALDEGQTHYAPNAGTTELREAVAAKYRKQYWEGYTKDHVIITVGAMEGLFLAMMTLLDPGDEILVPDPCFPNYYGQASSIGARAVPVPTYEEYDYRIQAADIEKAVTPRTRAILLNSPCNPTGAVLTKEDILAIAKVAKTHDLWVLTDEPYDAIVYDGIQPYSMAQVPEMQDRVMVLNSFSKSYAMTGWRIGYLVAPEPGYIAMMTLLDPGDEILVPDPCFPNYYGQASSIGARAVPVPTYEEYDYRIQAADIEKAVTPRTRAILLNSPCNPTGAVLTKEDILAIAKVAKTHDLWVLTDEPYDAIVYDGIQPYSMAQVPEMQDRVMVLNSFSKSYAMTGWRIGYLVAPEPGYIKKMAQLQEGVASCVSTFIQAAAVEALKSTACVDQMVADYTRRRDILVDGLNAIPGITCKKSAGSFYAFPNIKAFGKTSQAFAEELLENAGVVTVPGSAFGDMGEGYLRLVFANSDENLKEAVRRIADYVARAYPGIK